VCALSPLDDFVKLKTIHRTKDKKDKMDKDVYEPFPKKCVVLENFSLELDSAHSGFSGSSVVIGRMPWTRCTVTRKTRTLR